MLRFVYALGVVLVIHPARGAIFCSEPGFPIPDNDPAGVSDSLMINHPEFITDLDVVLEVPHTWIGDLVVTLRADKSEKSVTLVDRPGVPATPPCRGDDLITRLDDEATLTIEDHCSDVYVGRGYLAGVHYRPGDPPSSLLSVFDGRPLEGVWTLTVSDHDSGNVGELVRWCLVAPTRATAIGSEFQVNTWTTSSQTDPAVAIAPDGEFVVVWDSMGQDGDGSSIQAQRFASHGVPLGTEFQVNSSTTSNQSNPSVGIAPSGEFVVVWESSAQDGKLFSVQAQRFAADGTPVSDEFQVNTATTSSQRIPEVAVAPDGDFVVVWRNSGPDFGSIQGQQFAADGARFGSEFQVNTSTALGLYGPAVAIAAGGDFVVAWDGYQLDGDSFSVQGQRFASDGTPIGGEFQVNSSTTSSQSNPSVAIAHDGRFVVVWHSYFQDGDSFGVHGQRFASDGTAAGGEFQVNSFTTSTQGIPAVAAEPSGDFVVVWTSGVQDGDFLGIHGQRFASDGSAVGGEFQVNSYTTSIQTLPAVAVAPGGDFVSVWTSYLQDGDFRGVHGQRFGDPCVATFCSIFADGFESGNTESWSSTRP